MSLLERVSLTLARRSLIPPGAGVLVAVSGGPDSVALAQVLAMISARDRTFSLLALAHLNHRLRDADSDGDEAFCRGLASTLGIRFEVESADVLTLSREHRVSIEAAGRTARYEFLQRAARRVGADRIAVGHTRDDQAETYLLKLLRGAGAEGLAGIYPQRGPVVRPLLDSSRAEVLAYLEEHNLSFRYDASNEVLDNPRNRVRHELIPYLRQHFTPSVQDVLAREAEIARADAEYLEHQAVEAARSIVLEKEDGFELDGTALGALPAALARRVARRALISSAGGRFIGFPHVEALLQLAAAGGQGSADLPGQRATASAGRIRLTRRLEGLRADTPEVNFSRFPLSIPGTVDLASLGWTIAARPGVRPEPLSSSDWSMVAVAAGEMAMPLAVRTRRPGDRFRPLGLDGRKKLQDYFVDRKIARADRDKVPLVVDARDRIVWVVGQGISDDFRVTGGTEAVIILEARRSGGPG
jgi:tRNA(Ile)-lysidine synthase